MEEVPETGAGKDGNGRDLGLGKGRRGTERGAGEKKQGKGQRVGPGEKQKAADAVEDGGGQPMAEPKLHQQVGEVEEREKRDHKAPRWDGERRGQQCC